MKDKTTAGIFALFLGALGIHRFYLKQPGLGILYIVLSIFTVGFLGGLLGLIDAIVFFGMDQAEFDRRYNRGDVAADYDRSDRRYTQRETRREYRNTARNTARNTRPAPRETYSRRSATPSRRPAKPEQRVPRRERHNPFKITGIKKYKDFDLEGAIEDFNRGLEISPKDVSLHFNIACAYSLTEQTEKAYYHLDKSVAYGLKDVSKIKSHDDLAYVRIQDEFDAFEANGFRLPANSAGGGIPSLEAPKENLLDDDLLLSQLKRLADLREKGLLTEDEFTLEKKKLMRH